MFKFAQNFQEMFLGSKYAKGGKLDIICYWWRHADVIFPCL